MKMAKRFILASAAGVIFQFVPNDGWAQSAKSLSILDEGSASYGKFEVRDHEAIYPEEKEGLRVISQMPGWPKQVGCHPAYYPMRGLVFADLDQDGPLEIIMSGTDGVLHAWDHTGKYVRGFPVALEGICLNPPSVGDLDNDGDIEIVQLTRGVLDGGRFYILDHCGKCLPNFPMSINNNNLAGSAALVDLDDDGFLEIIVAERDIPIGYLHIFELDGTEWNNGWPVTLDSIPTGTATVGDIDNDGQLEIVYLSYTSIYILETSGSTVTGWPLQIADTSFSYQSPALADLDQDNDLEIILVAHKSAAGCYVFHHNGSPMEGWPQLVNTWTFCPPTVTDLESDGKLEILAGRAGNNAPTSPCFWAWNKSGETKDGFPYASMHGGGSEGPLTVADINGDGNMEIFADHNMMSSSGYGWLFGVDARGKNLPGFPLRPKGFTYMNGASIDDVDGDGDYELGVVSLNDDWVDINLYDLEEQWHPSDVSWATYHNKNQRGGLHKGQDRLHVQGLAKRAHLINIYLSDTPGYKAYLWASPRCGKIKTSAFGWFHLKPGTEMLTFLHNARIPANGEICVPVRIIDDPGLAGVTVYLQGLTGIDPQTGKGRLSNMVAKTIL